MKVGCVRNILVHIVERHGRELWHRTPCLGMFAPFLFVPHAFNSVVMYLINSIGFERILEIGEDLVKGSWCKNVRGNAG